MGIVAACSVPHPPLIIPEIGAGKEKKIQATVAAYGEAARRLAEYEPETVVLLSPHQTMYADYFHISPGEGANGDFGQFGAGQVRMSVRYDTEFVRALCKRCEADPASGREGVPAGTLGERDRRLDHGTMVPLSFLDPYLKEYRLVRIGLSGLPLSAHYELGRRIQETADELGRRVAVIASGDLSHRLKEDGPYGFCEEGPEYDRRIMEVLESGDFGKLFAFSEEFRGLAGECGHGSFTIMAGAFDGMDVRAKKLSYEGPFGVGYGVCTFEALEKNEQREFLRALRGEQKLALEKRRAKEDIYVRLARTTLEEYVRTGHAPRMPEGLPEELLSSRAGAFVSVKKEGQLRGCIGTIRATRASLAEEIMENAVSAVSRDPRFSPVESWELSLLEISVDVLGDTEPVDSPDDLDVKRYGVVVTKGNRRGLLLPNLDGIDTVERQIAVAKQKAGIGQEEEVTLERFEVVRHF